VNIIAQMIGKNILYLDIHLVIFMSKNAFLVKQ